VVGSPMSVQLAADVAPAEQAPPRLAPRQPLAADPFVSLRLAN